MNTDRVIFIIIGLFTVGILGFIISTSFTNTNQSSESLSAENVIGTTPRTKGANIADAKVVLVEFSDFECPACNSFAPVVAALANRYSSDLALVYRHFPLSNIHAYALPAARASEAAAMQGKFWEYHDELFLSQPDFSEEQLVSYAEYVGLDVDKFKSDMRSKEVAELVSEDVKISS